MAKSAYDRHRILNHIDSPLKILFWTMTDFKVLVAPIIMGFVMFKSTIIGLLIGIICFSIVRYIKRLYGTDKLQPLMYWHLPNHPKAKSLPASFKRRYNHGS